MACEGAVWLARVQCGTRGTGDSSRSGVCAGSLTPGILDTRRLSPRQGCESGRQPCAGQRSSSPGRRRPRESASGVPGTGRGACQCPDAIAVFLSLVGKLRMTTFWQNPQKPSNPDFSWKTAKTRKTQKTGKNRGFQRFHLARTFFTKTRFLPCFWRFQRFQVWKPVFTKTAVLCGFYAFSVFSTPDPGFHENSVFSVFFHVFSVFAPGGLFSRKRGF